MDMKIKEQQQAFLQDLLAPPVPIQAVAAPTATVVASEKSVVRPNPRNKTSLYDQTLESLAYIASFIMAAGLWIAGAFFTLVFLENAGLPVNVLSWGQWAIPLLVSAVELKLWPQRGRGPQRLLVWLVVLAFDIGTSWAGAASWGAGRHFNIFSGITLPSGGAGLALFALTLGLVFAFVPEKLGKWAVRELRTLWRI